MTTIAVLTHAVAMGIWDAFCLDFCLFVLQNMQFSVRFAIEILEIHYLASNDRLNEYAEMVCGCHIRRYQSVISIISVTYLYHLLSNVPCLKTVIKVSANPENGLYVQTVFISLKHVITRKAIILWHKALY